MHIAATFEGVTQNAEGSGERIQGEGLGYFLRWCVWNDGGGAPSDDRKPHNRYRNDLNAEVYQNKAATK